MSDSIEMLQARIASLSDLYSHIQAVRVIPSSILKRKPDPGLAPTRTVGSDFQQLRDFAGLVRSEPIQSALLDADERISADSSNLNSNFRREHRKRRRPPSPESPKPYVPGEKQRTSFFASSESLPRVTLDGLTVYTREFNQAQKEAKKPCRLHIWERTKGKGREQRPQTMRFTIPDVLTAYIKLGYTGADSVAIVQMLTAFGPRESKPPHKQSDFAVFRLLSQEIAKKIRSEEEVTLAAMVDLLCSYEDLFIQACTTCKYMLSAEGHVPPVVRLFKAGVREARHVTCQDESK
ncbi:hypothetical protein FA15DRAFT_349176 [Coprinopsis marcescibilis]|uniref:Uncharacterized protein n=1 Tax=Coprinopsis marcescibilis TaxID=230819 RepID=A0A5C3LB25_COPMA|nr:hypothetical protein FA15DRAFT_349176 [Coprinopsis marcescibilis]